MPKRRLPKHSAQQDPNVAKQWDRLIQLAEEGKAKELAALNEAQAALRKAKDEVKKRQRRLSQAEGDLKQLKKARDRGQFPPKSGSL